ncbi:MAG: type II secretion system protein [Sedimentisphaerales bacterium]|nr:type II secretion system protein [Sedimentisphaerales bacterium]
MQINNITQRHQKAFTLIELLVVVSIIALLVSILLPALNRARRQTKEMICGTNLHSLFNVVNIYATEHEDKFPELHESPVVEGRISDINERTSPYWAQGDWRKYLADEYGLVREALYSPTNPKWNNDTFYFGELAGDPDLTKRHEYGTQPHMVLGYTYYGSQMYGAALQNFLDSFINPPVAELHKPVFPRKLSDKARFDFVWTDINRQRPYNSAVNNWITPGDESRRWGSNHLYEAGGWPTGSHVANRDGSVTWTVGDDIERHVYALGTMYFW